MPATLSGKAAWAVVGSLRFPALRAGTIWHGTCYVLAPVSRCLPEGQLAGPAAQGCGGVPGRQDRQASAEVLGVVELQLGDRVGVAALVGV